MDFNNLLQSGKDNMDQAVEHLKLEYNNIRTGRANSSLVENLLVDSYGTKSPLKAVANISIPDAATIVIQPWDKNITPNIEKAFQNSNLGLNPVNEGQLLRISVPKPTEDKRKELVKVIRDKTEECRITLRNERQEIHQQIQEMKQKSEITEDDFYLFDKKVQKVLDDYIEQVNVLAKKKDDELMSI